MKTKIIYAAILFLLSIKLLGMDFPTKANQINDFIPKGWKIIVSEKGDLNKDNIEDVVLILENTDPNNFKKNEFLGVEYLNLNPRILLVLFSEKDGQYTLISKNEKNFVMSGNDEESPALLDPLDEGGINIFNNILKVSYSYFMSAGSWSASSIEYTFRYQNNRFELIGLDYNSFMRNSGISNSQSINFSTNKMKITTGENLFSEEDNKPIINWKNINIKNKYILDNMSSETGWEILNNVSN